MPQDQYFVVQGIYRGWFLLGIILAVAVVANLAMAYVARGQTGSMKFALLAAGLIVTTLAIFFIWTFPANEATQNWTIQPSNWMALRAPWEYSHAAKAALTLAVFCCTTWSVLSWRG